MTHAVKIDRVIKRETGRESALRNLISCNPRIHDEFRKTYPSVGDMEFGAYIMALDEFVKLKGLKIVHEEPEVVLDMKGMYWVAVTYHIEEPSI